MLFIGQNPLQESPVEPKDSYQLASKLPSRMPPYEQDQPMVLDKAADNQLDIIEVKLDNQIEELTMLTS